MASTTSLNCSNRWFTGISVSYSQYSNTENLPKEEYFEKYLTKNLSNVNNETVDPYTLGRTYLGAYFLTINEFYSDKDLLPLAYSILEKFGWKKLATYKSSHQAGLPKKDPVTGVSSFTKDNYKEDISLWMKLSGDIYDPRKEENKIEKPKLKVKKKTTKKSIKPAITKSKNVDINPIDKLGRYIFTG